MKINKQAINQWAIEVGHKTVGWIKKEDGIFNVYLRDAFGVMSYETSAVSFANAKKEVNQTGLRPHQCCTTKKCGIM